MGWGRNYGGQHVAQALWSAALALGVEERGFLPHSLHSSFIQPGNPAHPVVYQVLPIREVLPCMYMMHSFSLQRHGCKCQFLFIHAVILGSVLPLLFYMIRLSMKYDIWFPIIFIDVISESHFCVSSRSWEAEGFRCF